MGRRAGRAAPAHRWAVRAGAPAPPRAGLPARAAAPGRALDETGVVKKGDRSVDRDLYLPASWTQDPARCRTADIPEEVAFQTKPQLGQAMVARALAAGVPFGWVTGDRRLRVWLEEHAIRHVMAVKCTEPVWTMTDRGPGQVAAQDLIAEVEPAQWLRISAGDGSKGKRFYDWTWVPLWRWGWPAKVGFWLLARRSLSDPGELAYYVCFAPAAPRWSPWAGSRAAAGGSRKPSSKPRRSRARSLPGPPVSGLVPARHPGHGGAGVSGRDLRPPARRRRRGRGSRGDRAGRAGRALRRRAASTAGLPGLAPTGRPGVHAGLVALATTSSSHRSTHPLPATTPKTATVGLRRRSPPWPRPTWWSRRSESCGSSNGVPLPDTSG